MATSRRFPSFVVLALNSFTALSVNFASGLLASPHLLVGARLNFSDNGLLVFDLETTPPTPYGPFLTEGQLGVQGKLELAIVPSRKVALLTTNNGWGVAEVDISDPENPTIISTIDLPGSANDIAATRDGSVVLVSLAMTPTFSGGIASLSLSPLQIRWVVDLPDVESRGTYLEISPDGSTVIAGSLNDKLFVGAIQVGGHLSFTGEISDMQWAVNASFSPDGRTLIVSQLLGESARVFRNLGNGQLLPGDPPVVWGLPGGEQSVAFSHDGRFAYFLSVNPAPDELSSFRVVGPGSAQLFEPGFAQAATDCWWGAGYQGLDTLAVAPGDNILVAGQGSNLSHDPTNRLTIVHLLSGEVSSIDLGQFEPRGLGIVGEPELPTVLEVPALSLPGLAGLIAALGAVGLLRLRHG